MGARAEQLAQAFEQANTELMAEVEACSEQRWRVICPGEQWSVAVTAHHVAVTHEILAGLALMVANGQAVPPITAEMVHQSNAAHAAEHAQVSRADTLQALRERGATVAAMIRSLEDCALDRSADLPLTNGPMSAAQIIEMIVIGHPKDHLKSIRQAEA